MLFRQKAVLFLFYPTHVTRTAHPIIFDFIILTVSGTEQHQ